MPLPSYQVNVISCTTGEPLLIVGPPSLHDMRYSRRLNGIGVAALSFDYSDEIYAAFALDNYFEIYRTHPVTGALALEETYLARSYRRFREGNNERLVIGGVSLNHLLTRRLIDPRDDPASTAGYSVKSGAADTVMRAYVREQAADLASLARQFPGLTVDPVDGVGFPVDISARFINLFGVCTRIASEGGVDFQISRSSGTALVMTIERIGLNKSKTANYPGASWVGINPDRGNLSDPSLNIDRKEERNYVYALGQGQGENRQLVEASDSTTTLSPYNRAEFVKDARNVAQTNVSGLQSAAFGALADEKVKTEFQFQPTGQDAGSVYRLNWDLGYTITASWGDFSSDLRITAIEINLQDRDELMTITLGDEYENVS